MNDETAGNCHETARIELKSELLHAEITRVIIECFFAVYNKLGFGFLENVYCGALMLELKRRGHKVAREVLVPVLYEGVQIGRYKMDFIVDDLVVVEVKSGAVLGPTDRRQVLNYLRATELEVGLLLHFGPAPKFYRVASLNC